MRFNYRALSFAATTAVLAFAAMACGGGSSTTTPTTAASTNGTPAAGAAADGGSANGATPDDATYVTAVCTDVNATLNPILNKVAADPSLLSNQQKLIADSTPALSDLSDKLAALTPPADLKPYHDQIVSRFKDIVTQAKSGQLKGIGDVNSVTRGVSVPQDVKDRVRSTAAQVPACQQSLVFGSDFFG